MADRYRYTLTFDIEIEDRIRLQAAALGSKFNPNTGTMVPDNLLWDLNRALFFPMGEQFLAVGGSRARVRSSPGSDRVVGADAAG